MFVIVLNTLLFYMEYKGSHHREERKFLSCNSLQEIVLLCGSGLEVEGFLKHAAW